MKIINYKTTKRSVIARNLMTRQSGPTARLLHCIRNDRCKL